MLGELFPGQYYDKETKLFYNWNRYYSPKLGRYITSDPIGLTGGFNTYLYAFGNPVIWFDLDGLLACTYEITARQLKCTNNAGQSMTINGGHVKAGQGKCQDKLACIKKKKKGPLPPGMYTIYSASQTKSKRHPRWMFLGPNAANQMYKRKGFFIHPWGISEGCITIYFNSDFKKLSKWAEQDKGGTMNVKE